MLRRAEKLIDLYESISADNLCEALLIIIGVPLVILFDIFLLICFILSYTIGDDLLDKLKNQLICHIIGYSIMAFHDVLVFHLVLTSSIIFAGILSEFSILALLAILYEIGITIWSLLSLIKLWDGNLTFLYVIMLIQVPSMILSIIKILYENSKIAR